MLRDELINELELNCHVTKDLATNGLDAILDALESNADRWWQAWFESERPLYDTAPRTEHLAELVAALRSSP